MKAVKINNYKEMMKSKVLEKLFKERLIKEDGHQMIEEDLDFNSRIAQENIAYINECLNSDEEIIDEYLSFNVSEDDIMPVPCYREYLSLGLQYIVKVVDGKISKEVILDDRLKLVVTNCILEFEIIDDEDDSYYLVLYPCHPLIGKSRVEYKELLEACSDVVNVLIDNNLVQVVEVDDFDED